MSLRKRIKDGARPAALHLVASGLVAGLVSFLVFLIWFPSPYDEISGGRQIFLLLVLIDVVSGPLLTLVTFSKKKSKRELAFDFSIVIALQLGALLYGVNSLAEARPLALVYEVDRFRLVSYADIYESELKLAPEWAKPWKFSDIQILGVRATTDIDELSRSVELALAGIEPSQRPSRWQDYQKSTAEILKRARPLSLLRAQRPEKKGGLDSAVSLAILNIALGETADGDALLWLPVVSRQNTDWVALLDPTTGRVRGYAHADGFLQ